MNFLNIFILCCFFFIYKIITSKHPRTSLFNGLSSGSQLSKGFEINGVIVTHATVHTVAYLVITQDNSNPLKS